MVYLKNTTERQILCIPKQTRVAFGGLIFKVTNTRNQTLVLFNAEDEETSLLYHKIPIELSDDIQPGEYEYSLSDECGVLSSGLLVIGDLENFIEYKAMTEYEQYEN